MKARVSTQRIAIAKALYRSAFKLNFKGYRNIYRQAKTKDETVSLRQFLRVRVVSNKRGVAGLALRRTFERHLRIPATIHLVQIRPNLFCVATTRLLLLAEGGRSDHTVHTEGKKRQRLLG